MMKETNGVCFLYTETGTEGGWWAMQELSIKATGCRLDPERPFVGSAIRTQ